MNANLYAQVRRKLNITWHDEDTEKRLEDIIESAIPIMKHKLGIAGTSFNFAEKGAENRLFLSYCLYEWNHSANEFDANYANEIAQIRAKNDVAHYLASGGVESGETQI